MAELTFGKARKRNRQEDVFIATQWTLMWRKFRKHKLAMVGTSLVVIFYVIAIFCEFVATHDPFKRNTQFIHAAAADSPARLIWLLAVCLWA